MFANAGNNILTQEKTILEEWGVFANNPLTPDLNPPVQRQPVEVFKFGIQFLKLTLRKKNHISYTFPSNFRK
jgi:hypothetical protein